MNVAAVAWFVAPILLLGACYALYVVAVRDAEHAASPE